MFDKGAVQEWNFLTETIKRRYPRNRIAATSVSFLANKTESILAPVCCIPLVKYRNFLSVASLFDTGLARFLFLIPDTLGHAVKGGGGGLNVNQVVNVYIYIYPTSKRRKRESEILKRKERCITKKRYPRYVFSLFLFYTRFVIYSSSFRVFVAV